MVSNLLPQREEYLKKKRRKKLFKYVNIFALIILIIGIFSYVTHRPEIRISKVELSGGALVKKDEVETETLSFLEGSYFWLVPKNNSFLYPQKKLENYLKDSFKRINTIEVSLKDLDVLQINITEKKAVAIWCDTLPESQSLPPPEALMENGSYKSEGFCYFMDQNGNIFAEAPYFSGDAYFKYYGLVQVSSDIGTPIGTFYISSTTKFAEITDFIEKTKKLSLDPQYLIAKSQEEFLLIIGGGGEIYFDTQKPLSVVSENLETLLENPPLSKYKGKVLPVEYIDLRFGNKLFYKLR